MEWEVLSYHLTINTQCQQSTILAIISQPFINYCDIHSGYFTLFQHQESSFSYSDLHKAHRVFKEDSRRMEKQFP